MGGDGGGVVVESTDSAGSNVQVEQASRHFGRAQRGRRPGHITVAERECTLDTCIHCCKCHILRPRNEYGTCVRRSGKPHPACQCKGKCTHGRCAPRECQSNHVLSSSSAADDSPAGNNRCSRSSVGRAIAVHRAHFATSTSRRSITIISRADDRSEMR